MIKNVEKTFILFLVIGLSLFLVCSLAFSQDFPKKPIKLIATADVGGGEDTEARGIAPYLQKYLGVSVMVENQGGAGGKIAFEKIQKTEPDGYSLIVSTFPKSIIIEYMGKVGYRTKDFTPVYAWALTNQLLVGHADTWKNIDEFLKDAKTRTLSGGLSGRGSTTHLAGLVAMEGLGVKVNWVPYEGSAGSVAALAGKHLDFTLCLSTSATSLIQAGKLRPLLLFGDERDPYLPDVPIPKEIGLNIPSMPALRGAEAPPNTPPAIVKVLEAGFDKSVKDPAFIEWAKKRKMVLRSFRPQEFGKILLDTYPQVEKFQKMLSE
jgi:tripartite-type tricarboxylate transporter receptor subunit TctC